MLSLQSSIQMKDVATERQCHLKVVPKQQYVTIVPTCTYVATGNILQGRSNDVQLIKQQQLVGVATHLAALVQYVGLGLMMKLYPCKHTFVYQYPCFFFPKIILANLATKFCHVEAFVDPSVRQEPSAHAILSSTGVALAPANACNPTSLLSGPITAQLSRQKQPVSSPSCPLNKRLSASLAANPCLLSSQLTQRTPNSAQTQNWRMRVHPKLKYNVTETTNQQPQPPMTSPLLPHLPFVRKLDTSKGPVT